MKKTVLLYCLLWLVPGALYPQSPKLEVLSSDHGLSQGMVYSILQDRQGFLWFGTRDGLNRYDGYQFHVYKNDPFNRFSVSDNIIKALFEDRLGRIWVGTESNGVDILDPSTGQFYHLNTGKSGLSNQNVNVFAETPDGFVWVGTENGLNKVKIPDVLSPDNPDLSEFSICQSFFWEANDNQFPRPNIFTHLLLDKKGVFWVGTGRDAYRFDPSTGEYTVVPIRETMDQTIRNRVNCIAQGPNGTIWIGQFRRIICFNGDQMYTLPLPQLQDNNMTGLVFDADGNLIASRRKEVVMMTAADLAPMMEGKPLTIQPRQHLICPFPRQDVIGATGILCDRTGLVWIGTNGYGIRKYNPANRLFQHYLPGYSARKIVVNPRGECWVWMVPSIFFKLDFEKNSVGAPIIGDRNYFQHAMLFDRQGTCWVLMQKKGEAEERTVLAKKDMKSGRVEMIPGMVSAAIYGLLMEDRNGHIWITGNLTELDCFDPQTQTHKLYDLSGLTGFKEPFFAIYEDVQGAIWLGTAHGLIRGAPQPDGKMDFRMYRNNPNDFNSLNNNSILSLLDDPQQPEKYLWIGTRGGGLNLMNKETGVCRHFTTADGLSNEVVYGALADEFGNIWLSTNSGISKYYPQTARFENYSAADGLQDNEFNTSSYAKMADGRIIFGGVNGFTLFDPAKFHVVNAPSEIAFTALMVQHKERKGEIDLLPAVRSGEITLNYDQDHFTIGFAALDYTAPNKNQYRYRLLDVDPNWSEATTQHSTTYSNLPPGTYVFEVITGGVHGVWSGKPAHLTIHILPPFWRSYPAYVIYCLLLGVIGWFAYRAQVRRIQLKEQLAFEHRESERIKALEKVKSDFFSNITHELRTPLTLIVEPLHQVVSNPKAEDWFSKVRMAENNSRRLLQIVNQLLDLAKLEAQAMKPEYSRGQISDLLTATFASFEAKAAGKNVAWICRPPATPLPTFDFDTDKVEKIVSNLLSNAIKFTPEGGKVIMHWWDENERWLVLEVTDTGVGIAAEDLPRVFDRFFSKNRSRNDQKGSTGIGLSLSLELAEVMGGYMEAESQLGAGAVFRLHLPILNAYSKTETGESSAQGTAQLSDRAPRATSSSFLHQPMLLLAEDNEELRTFLVQSLSPKFEVIEAPDGRIAADLAFQRIPDLVVSDVMMPYVDGLGLLDALKNDVRTSHIPVVLLTAKSSLENRVEGLKHGADAYLAKPFQTKELLAWLDNLLEGRRRLQSNYQRAFGQTASDTPPPDAAQTIGVLDRRFLEQFRAVVENEISNDQITADDLARAMAMSRSQLHRKLVALTGYSVSEYLRNLRLDKAHELLKEKAGNVSEIAWKVGFVNAKHFSTAFKERFGKSPKEV